MAMDDVKTASKEELAQWLNELREQRKKGYEHSKRSTRKAPGPYADIDDELAQRILDEMMKDNGG